MTESIGNRDITIIDSEIFSSKTVWRGIRK